jgi:hypothetical protein
MGLFATIFFIGVGVIGLGYVYHRWTATTTAVIDKTATAVNTVIDDVKSKISK